MIDCEGLLIVEGGTTSVNNIRWMSLFGQFEVAGESVRFMPMLETDDSGESTLSAAQIASNLEFSQGEVSFDITFEDPHSVCTVVFNTGEESGQLHIGLNLGGAYGVAKLSDTWQSIKSVGVVGQLQPDKTYHFRVSIFGKETKIYVNDVMVLETQIEVTRSPLHLYAFGRGAITFSRFKCERPKIFVSLSEPVSALCGSLVNRVASEWLFDVNVVNLEYGSVDDVFDAARKSMAIITNVSPNYLQGFYHVGLFQGAGKPALVLCNKTERGLYEFHAGTTQMVYFDESPTAQRHINDALIRFLESLG